MEKPAGNRILRAVALVTGVMAPLALVLLHVIAGADILPESTEIHVLMPAGCYLALTCAVTAIGTGLLSRTPAEFPLGIVIFLVALSLIVLGLMEMMRLGFGDFWSRTACRQAMLTCCARVIRSSTATLPATFDDCPLPQCTLYRKFPPGRPRSPAPSA